MASRFTLPAFKFPAIQAGKAALENKGVMRFALPLSGRFSAVQEIRFLSRSLVVFFVIAAAAYVNNHEAAYTARYLTQSGKLLMLYSSAGMDGIRERIQETAKRIKQLGESSQEIGEIVDMISDITEQTNVLALNAAIQAASAGEDGRGFSVVAEEVQHLAERSAEATKQIGVLVQAIQGDTQDAMAAMEKSTLGVVEVAGLSEVAGRSLHEIEQVSNELAVLINSISASTRLQAGMAGEVVQAMQDILKITQQTTDGTRLNANSIAQINSLATDLKGSVAGFKL